jgi:hypothetical protein
MPVLQVLGLDTTFSDVHFDELRTYLKGAVASIPELEISPAQVTVKFSEEKTPDTTEVMVFVFGLAPKKKRNKKVRDIMATAIVAEIDDFIRLCYKADDKKVLVECFIMPYAIGFAANRT